ncbi:MAG: hypothetical protein V7723_07815 [Sneathiella sp.]|uniref:hypothetical protein n=1 Tax=Sneathiella sp. TaxID=1964365 RepID=UPI003001C929
MSASKRIREVHDLTGLVAHHYVLKYGEQAASILQEAARGFEENDDLHGRNKMLRLRDEVLILAPPLKSE